MSVLERSLEMRAKAHEVHVSNLSNANVPNFKAKKIAFESQLQQAISGLESGDSPIIDRQLNAELKLSEVSPEIIDDPMAKPNGDGNTVNLEKETTNVAKNTIAYNATIEMLNRNFMLTKSVLDGVR